jgi:hypothetical protein
MRSAVAGREFRFVALVGCGIRVVHVVSVRLKKQRRDLL